MRDRKSKKVVIINDIYSDTIEQAIFILRNNGNAVSIGTGTTPIVKEAQRVINSYIETIEKTKASIAKKEYCGARKKDVSPWRKRLFKASVVLTTIGTVGWGLYNIFNAMLAKI